MSQSEIVLTHSSEPLGASDSEPPIKVAEYLQLVLRRWRLILVVCILTVGIGLVHYFITPEAFRSSTVLQIEQQTLVRFSSESNPWLDAWASIKYYPTQYRLLQSRGLAERVVLKLRLMDDPDFNPSAASDLDGSGMDPTEVARLANRLRLRLEVDPVKDTELVRLSYASSDPELAARIVNATAEAFIDWGIESRTDTIGRASSFLAEQIETLKLEIDAKENQLQEYSRSSDIVAIDPDSNVTLQRLDRLNQEYERAATNRSSRRRTA